MQKGIVHWCSKKGIVTGIEKDIVNLDQKLRSSKTHLKHCKALQHFSLFCSVYLKTNALNTLCKVEYNSALHTLRNRSNFLLKDNWS